MKRSNNNIINSFICRNQDVLRMKFLDTLFQMQKREFRFKGEDQGYSSKTKYVFNDLKNV